MRVPDRMIDPDDLNAACERFLAHFLRGQLAELEWMGAGDIDYAHQARDYLRRYDAAAEPSEPGASPLKGRHLKLAG
jgi:hypothetical protein